MRRDESGEVGRCPRRSRLSHAVGGLLVACACLLLLAHREPGGPVVGPAPAALEPLDLVTVSQLSKQVYPGYPECQERMKWLKDHWQATPKAEAEYRQGGVNGTEASFLLYLNQHGLYCPTLADANKELIRGVNLGGWLVLEPWITPSLFEQFLPSDNVVDHWSFCEKLGKTECLRQLRVHWSTWVVESDIQRLAAAGINHVRIPVGYWVMGDIRPDEPWVPGELSYLQRAMLWCKKYNVSVMFDLHCAPGSQNGFDNSGRKGGIHWADTAKGPGPGAPATYPNMDRSLTVIAALVAMFSLEPFEGVVHYIELVNEAFMTIDIKLVKDFYKRGYRTVRNINPNIGVVIGDSFRFQSWKSFMYPPEFNHVYIDTHVYQVFDAYRLAMTPEQHIEQTCKIILPQVAIAPLSTIVGEWSAALTDCAQWLNGYGSGSRLDGTMDGATYIASCEGQQDVNNATVFTDAYKQDLRRYTEAQMQAYESGSSQGWFFWNFKTERAPQWDYLLGLQQGWIPQTPGDRAFKCPE